MRLLILLLRRGLPVLAIACMLLSGCASPMVRSEVVAFNEWSADAGEKSFAFAPMPGQAEDAEYRHYQDLVRAELRRLGLIESASPRLHVTLQYSFSARDVRVIDQVVDPWYGAPFYGPRWHPYGPFYGPFYDPFWYSPPMVRPVERQFLVYGRELKIALVRSADKRSLYQVTVHSEGGNPLLAAVMPAMIRSAFADFPGMSGVPRVVEMKLDAVPGR
ncbi:MAG TPA: DUF4136 domain-containing protein [Acetobacteraceae bacterium]